MRIGFAALFAGITAGCGSDPEPNVTFYVSAFGTLGAKESASVSVERVRKDCRAWQGGEVLKCERREEMPAEIVELRCEPADACGRIEAGPGRIEWVMLAKNYQLTLVAAVGTGHLERTFSIRAMGPRVRIDQDEPALATFAEAPRTYCLEAPPSHVIVSTYFEVSFDGAPLAFEEVSERCVRVAPPRPGALRIAARLMEGSGAVMAERELPVLDAALAAPPYTR